MMQVNIRDQTVDSSYASDQYIALLLIFLVLSSNLTVLPQALPISPQALSISLQAVEHAPANLYALAWDVIE